MATALLVIIYILAIGLGVPDSTLGAAWPAIYPDLNLDISMANFISAIVACGTIASSLLSARLIRRLGIAKVTAVSTVMTALALLGYAVAPNLFVICLFAVPLGLGAGAIDTAINNYMALHYKAMYMNFMHCFYGVGVMISPYLMSLALAAKTWRFGYLLVAGVQTVVALVSFVAIPLWGKVKTVGGETESVEIRTLRLGDALKNRAIRFACLFFFASTAIESVCTVWGASYMTETKGFPPSDAASYLVLYYLGLTVGRILSGLLSDKVSAWTILKIGPACMATGVLTLFAGSHPAVVMVGLFLIGLGVAPIFPTLVFLTPQNFGAEISQSVTGIEMACAYCGILTAPVIFGLLTRVFSTGFYPVYLGAFVALTAVALVCLTRSLRRERAADDGREGSPRENA